jgi:phage-related holin
MVQYHKFYETMKGLMILAAGTFLNVKFNFLPKADLVVIMGICLVVDFISGLMKAVVLGKKRTSTGFRQTLIKFIQYGSALLIGMCISYLGTQMQEYNETWSNASKYMSWFNSGLLIFIILIEIVSILENLYEMNSTSKFAQYAIKPALRILTIELKNNPLTKITIETEDEKITKEGVILKQTTKE